MPKVICAILFAIGSLAISTGRATDFSLTATIGGAFDLDFNPISIETALSTGVPVIWQVDFAVATQNLSSGEAGFGNLGFSVSFQNASDAFDLGWQPRDASNSLDPWGSNGSLFAFNLDAGPSSADEHGILVSIAPGVTNPSDPRYQIGQTLGSPDRVGSLFVRDDFLENASLSIDLAMFASNTVEGKFANVQTAYGQNTFVLPRLNAQPSQLDFSTANAPPAPELPPTPVFEPPVEVPTSPEPITPTTPEIVDPFVPDVPLDQPTEEPAQDPETTNPPEQGANEEVESVPDITLPIDETEQIIDEIVMRPFPMPILTWPWLDYPLTDCCTLSLIDYVNDYSPIDIAEIALFDDLSELSFFNNDISIGDLAYTFSSTAYDRLHTNLQINVPEPASIVFVFAFLLGAGRLPKRS